MKTFLLAVGLLAAVIGLSIAGMQFAIYRNENSPEGLANQQRVADAVKTRKDTELHLAELAVDRCNGTVDSILRQNRQHPIAAYGDIPGPLASDIALCLDRGIMSPYAKDRLLDSKLLQLFVAL